MKRCFKCQDVVEYPVHGLHETCFREWFGLSLSSSTEFDKLALKSENQIHDNQHPIHTSFFHGKFKKYAAVLEKKTYILKVEDNDYPELPHVEYFCNQIASKLGLAVPAFYFIRFMNHTDTFVVKNFMEKHKSANLVHIYRFMQEGQNFSCRVILNIIENKIGHISAMKQFVLLCLFDALIGNHDRHGRNIGFINKPKGFELAPFYDNPSYLGIEEESFLLARHSPKGKIETSHSKEPTMREYVKEFIELGYVDWVKDFYKKSQRLNCHHFSGFHMISPKRQKALLNLIEQRMKELHDGL
jgi:hypothetical protein